jgi:hypothetical protein
LIDFEYIVLHPTQSFVVYGVTVRKRIRFTQGAIGAQEMENEPSMFLLLCSPLMLPTTVSNHF